MDSSRDSTCMRCEQVEDLLTMVAELKKDMEKLRHSRECEQEVD